MQQNLQHTCKDTTLLLTFASNHDSSRLAALSPSIILRMNALAYTMLSDGIPTLYQGDEQSFSGNADPENREAVWLSGFNKNVPLYVMIQTLNKLRTWVGQHDSSYWRSTSSIFSSDANTLVIRKGMSGSQVVAVLTNRGDGLVAESTKVANIGFAAGTTLMEVVACEQVVVGQDGVLTVDMSGGNPKVFFPLIKLSGSMICPSSPTKAATLTSRFIARPLAQLSLWLSR
jgi:alpha-amylase